MVFLNYALYPRIRLFDNMVFGLQIAKSLIEEVKARLGKAAGISELSLPPQPGQHFCALPRADRVHWFDAQTLQRPP